MSTLAKNVSQVVLYENQVSNFVALLWMQTPLGHWTRSRFSLFFLFFFVCAFYKYVTLMRIYAEVDLIM